MKGRPAPVAAPPGGVDGSRLARRLRLRDAVFIGLGSMIGAGIFAAIGPAADAAESWLLVSLGVAGAVALCNALSSAQLAAIYPAAGGTYVYGRERLGEFWGFLAGWGFVIGKVASCAAMALTFGYYANEDFARVLAVVAVIAFTLVNVLGVRKTAAVTTLLVLAVLATLTLPITAGLTLDSADFSRALPSGGPPGGLGVVEAAGLLFFAFAGYARIATLGEEVVEPERTIPRAIPLAFAITLAVYALVIASALVALGPEGMAASAAPLADVMDAGALSGLTPLLRAGAALASLSVLLSLLAGVSRTAFAMARERDLPGWLGVVHRRYETPHRAETAVGAVVAALAATLDLRDAIGFSAFAVLLYYALANASAWTLDERERRWPRWIAVAGLAGCVTLASTLPLSATLPGVALFACGALYYLARHRMTPGA
ncbi:MAG TPA: APC family permease [Dehalococcoidia bacterium]|nr:APC family permease [Dehalococcoidia bacterium]